MRQYCKTTKDGLLISCPPKEKGQNTLFRVVYVVDVPGSGGLEAAQEAHKILNDPDSMPPVLHVLSCDGQVQTIDLSDASASQGGV
jgi:hypothetical protein